MVHHAPTRLGTSHPAPPASRRAWLGLATLLLPVFLVSMDASVLNIALPRITESLQPTAAEQLWILDVYAFLLAGLLITMGNLGDRWGRRRLMMYGATLFAVASVAAAFAPSAGAMIAARAVMGIGGATLMPSSLALIGSMFAGARSRDRALAVGIWSAAFSFGVAVGPVIGGVLLHHYWWGSVFLINVPVFVAMLAVGPFLIPEYRNGITARFDFLGVALSMGAILPLVYAVKSAATEGLTLRTVSTAIAGAILLLVFVQQQRRHPNPLLGLDLFADRTFTVAIVGSVIAIASLGAMSFLGGIYLQTVLGLDVLAAALLSLPTALVVAYFSMRAPWIENYLGRRNTFVLALIAAGIGQFVLLLLGPHGSAWAYVAGSVIAGVGYGILFTFTSVVSLAAAPPERAGQASAMSEMSFELGTALGIAVLGSVATAVFTASGRVEETLGQTLASADSALTEFALHEWVHGLHVTVGLSGVTLFVLAGLAWAVMGSGRTVEDPHQREVRPTDASAAELVGLTE